MRIQLWDAAENFDIGSDGVLKENVSKTSEDGRLTINISRDTKALDASGGRLRELEVSIVEPPPQPPDGCHVLAAFDFEPQGATFDPPMEITIAYDPDSLPEGMSEENLVIAVFNDETGEWTFITGMVDTELNVVTFYMAHFTVYGLLAAPGPAETTPTFTPAVTATPTPGVSGGSDAGKWIGTGVGVALFLGILAVAWLIFRKIHRAKPLP